METTVNIPLKLTDGAVKEVKRLIEAGEDYQEGQYLRVGVKGGGCSGLTYVLGFDNKEEDDAVYEINGVSVIMKEAHAIYLHGIEVDFQKGLNARGFIFNNPNASDTCGCGTSFSI